MLAAGVRNTDSDIEYDSICLITQSNSLDYNYFDSVSPPFLSQKLVHQSLFYKYGVDTIVDTDCVATHCDNINTIRNNNNNVRAVTTCDGGISHNGIDTLPDTDRDLVNSGVVFVLQLLFYNLQRLDLYDNEHTYNIHDIRVFDNNDLDCVPVSSTVHYGVVYVYIYENDVAQQLYYNIQHFSPYNNNKCNNNRPQYVILDHTVNIQDDDTVNYVVNDIF